MGNRGRRDIGWAPTLGKMLEVGVKAFACCSRCGRQQPIDIAVLIEKVGPDFCLHNRRQKLCKLKDGCRGYNYFSTDRWGGIITPFRDEATGARWLSEISRNR